MAENLKLTTQYSAEVIDRAARRLFEGAEDSVPGVYDLEFYRERVAANPEHYVREGDCTEEK